MSHLLFLEDEKIKEIFEEIISYISDECEIYLVSGSVRNSLYYHFFQKKLPQRDFDAVLVGNPDAFIQYLQKNGWVTDKNTKKSDGIILFKAKRGIENPTWNFEDYVFLDLMFSAENLTIQDNLKKNANFTLNGGAINVKDIFSENWIEKIITLPSTINDIENKKIVINNINNCDGTDIFACLRFMSQGFHQPSDDQIEVLLQALQGLKKSRFERNIKKLYTYVGGEQQARNLLTKLGIEKDIFDYEIVQDM